MLKVIYVLFLGLILTVAVGVGIAAFYPEPEAPTYPNTTGQSSAEQQAAQQEYDKQLQQHHEASAEYNRNVSLIVLGFALVFLVLGLTLQAKADVLADGLLLGGLLTLLYSVIRGFNADDDKYTFVLVVVGLGMALVLGYLKFVKPPAGSKKTKSKRKK